jgi:hypothetical protein
MSKKIMLLALGAAVSLMMLALPAIASAKIPLHLTPQPIGAKTVDGIGKSFLSGSGGGTITCDKFHGSASFTSTTGGTMHLTFGPHCTESEFNSTCTTSGATSGAITTTPLNFSLVTLAGKSAGLEVTAPSGQFAHFICAGFIAVTVEAHNGVLGTITTPGCGGSSSEPVIKFEQTKHGEQKHRFLEGTPNTLYNLKKPNGETSAQNAEGKVTLGGVHHLECT